MLKAPIYFNPSNAEGHSKLATWLILAGVFYNAFLAIVNAHVMPIKEMHVMVTEGIIIAFSGLLITSKLRGFKTIAPHLAFAISIFILFFWVSISNQSLYLKSLRDMAIIIIFLLLGELVAEKMLIKLFRLMTMAIIIIMVQEAWITDSYARLFEPALYFANTRGIEQLSVDSSGLFRNSLGFEDRFSYGILNTHRLSSIFLEQVSLANFSMVLSLFCSAFWPQLKLFDKCLYLSTIIFIILSNNSRTASIVNVLIFFNYFIFPKLPKNSNLLYMPCILLFSILFIYNPNHKADDFQGRISHTLQILGNLDLTAYMTGNIHNVLSTADSGYVYLICTQTIVGLILFWIFSSLIVPSINNSTKRFIHGMSIYLATNLLIGEAILSIKVAAPLWAIAGFLRYKTYSLVTNKNAG